MVDQVPFTDVYIDDEMVAAVEDVLRSGRHVKGPIVERFENKFAAATSVEHAVGVSNGTAAMLLGMKALGISDGDQVFVPAHTYFATVSPVLELGADPTFVDIDPKRYTMDAAALRDAVTVSDDPAAIAVTHMHGQPADMDPIRAVADEYNIPLIEDGAQAHLATYGSEVVGSMGDIGCFSFYPTKNMTVGGDGGMITTDNDKVAAQLRALRNHGRNDAGDHAELGLNYRLDETNGAVGIQQLEHLPQWNEGRRRVARTYDETLAGSDSIVTPTTYDDTKHVYHHYPVQVPSEERNQFREILHEHGVDTGIHYKHAVHEQPAVRDRVGRVSAPAAESYCARTVSLPMHPRLTDGEIEVVVDAVEAYEAQR